MPRLDKLSRRRNPQALVQFSSHSARFREPLSGLTTKSTVITLRLRSGVMFTNDPPVALYLGRLRSVRDSYSMSELSRATGS
jgi:hypothetical protein